MAETVRLTIEPEVPLGKLLLRCDAVVAEAAGAALGLVLPKTVNRASLGDGCRAIRLGPDEYLLLMAEERVEATGRNLGAALADRHHALVDISARLVALAIAGEAARDTLAAACPLDLHSRAFGPDQATRSLFGKAEIILDCLAPERFRLLTNRSFAPYVRRLLAEVGREFGSERQAKE
jgi:sarcosine oxidase, subunit gamma